MADEFFMELDTPEEGTQEMKVRPLGNGLFLSLTEAEPLSRFQVLCGDKFEADKREDGTYLLRRIIEPFDVVHFEVRSGSEKSGIRISDISASMGDGSRRPTGAESNEKTSP